MQPDCPRLEKLQHTHFTKSVVIGITYNEPRQAKKEVDGEKAMADKINISAWKYKLCKMEYHYRQSGHATQPIQNFKVLFGF
jgi:uncharacterized protein YegJ (DUF2314 family)